MTYPMKQEIIDTLAKIESDGDLNPTYDQYEAVTETLVTLIKTHGFEAADAYRLVRTIFWYGWNEGWTKGYAHPPRIDQGSTPL